MRSLLPLLALCLLACERSSTEAPVAAAAPAQPTVETVPVVAERLDITARLTAELQPYEMVALYPRVSGFVEEIGVDRGSPVRRGQLLARLSAPELAAQRSEAESKLQAARSTFERMRAASD